MECTNFLGHPMYTLINNHGKISFLESPFGDIFNWNEQESNWQLSNVTKINLDTSDFCLDFPDKNYFMLPERRSLESAYAACKIMGKVNNRVHVQTM